MDSQLSRSTLTRRQFLGVTASAVAAAPFVRTASAQGKEVKVLSWSHFVPSYDEWYKKFAAEYSVKTGVKVTVDFIPHLQLPAKLAAEVATQSGHDMVMFHGSGTHKWAEQCVELTDLANELGKKHGGWAPMATNLSVKDGKWYSIPEYFIRFPGLYRRDLWTEVGMANGPDSWDDLRRGGAQIKKKNHSVVGIGLGNHHDADASWRALMWSYGAAEFSKDGRHSTIDGKETREALKYAKALYDEAMTPEVLGWDDSSNNRLLASGRGSWIHNPISAYRTIQKENPELAAKVFIGNTPKGPATRMSYGVGVSYGIWKFSKATGEARRFLTSLIEAWPEPFKASTGYDHPFLKAFAKKPMPILGEDPKLTILQDFAEISSTLGHPGPATAAADEAFQTYTVPNMFAKYCTGKASLDDAVREAASRNKAILAKYA